MINIILGCLVDYVQLTILVWNGRMIKVRECVFSQNKKQIQNRGD